LPTCSHKPMTFAADAVKTHFQILAELSSNGTQCKAVAMALAKVMLEHERTKFHSTLFYLKI
jgi:hypothetical protein